MIRELLHEKDLSFSMTDRFSKLHPAVQLLFFLSTFVLVMSVQNPVFSLISVISVLIYEAKARGKNVFSSIKLVAFTVSAVGLFNMLFAHYGVDVLFTVNNIEFTLEALLFGINQGLVLASVIIWFSAFSRIVDSERVIYLFRFAPKCALIFSMVLGFIPRFTKKLTDINEAGLALGSKEALTVKDKLNRSVHNFSALITYSLESSVITANSMNARGYSPRAIRKGRYKYTISDIAMIAIIIITSAIVVYKKATGAIAFIFDPVIKMESLSITAIFSFTLLQLLPLAVDLYEDLLWKLSNVKN